jgi:hypothetical protein
MSMILVFTDGETVFLVRDMPDVPASEQELIGFNTRAWNSLVQQVRDNDLTVCPDDMPMRFTFTFTEGGDFSTTAFTGREWFFLFEILKSKTFEPVAIGSSE